MIWPAVGAFAAVVASLLLARLQRWWRTGAVLRRQFDGPKPSSVLLGHAADFDRFDRHRSVLQWTKEYGGIFYARILWAHLLVVTDPALAAEVLHSRQLDKVSAAYQGFAAMMSESGHPDLVSSLTNDTWRLLRKGVAPAFSPHNIRRGFGQAAVAAHQLVEALTARSADGPIDIVEALLAQTIDVIGQFGFRHDFQAVRLYGAGKRSEMMDVMMQAELEVDRRLRNPLRKWMAYFSEEGRQALGYFCQFQELNRQLLAEMRSRGPPAADDASIGAHLLRLRDPKSNRPLSDALLLPQICVFFFAGLDTTGHTMAWILYLISQHPEVEGKIVAELGALGTLPTAAQPQPQLAYEDLGKLPYLTCVIKESMRMLPATAIGTLRQTARETVLSGGRYTIPANVGLWLPIYAIHNSPHNWPRPDEFLPERWMEPGTEYAQSSGSGADADAAHDEATAERGVEATSSSSLFEMSIKRDYRVGVPTADKVKRFLPFSDGRRDCVGQSLAKMNYTLTLATLLAHFHFELAPEAGGPDNIRASEVMAVTLKPKDGILMNCQPRNVGYMRRAME